MIERRDLTSWLEGPASVTGADHGYPGERLGLPRSGAGSIPGFGRRLLALAVDWVLCLVISGLPFVNFGQASALEPLALLAVEHVLLVGTLGTSIGHRMFGLRVARLDGAFVGPLRALVRTLLLVLVVPAMISNRDRRGLHDQAAGTVVLRAGSAVGGS